MPRSSLFSRFLFMALKSRGRYFAKYSQNTQVWNLKAKFQGSHSDWKTWINGKTFSSQGKVRENHTKYWKTQMISDKYDLLYLNELCIIC